VDLIKFGSSIDWRRAFITTDKNPYYDSFIQWQFNTLHKNGYLFFGNRPSIYSPIDEQQCADHDRASGEGVNPQEYTLIKIEVAKPFPSVFAALEKPGVRVFLAAATLRPETMFGQTNAWILPDGDYGAYKHNDGEVLVMAERAAMNVSFQGPKNGYTGEEGKPECLVNFKGRELFGAALHAPLAKYEKVYCLPLLTIKMNKGTGVVTSVPADAPDDYMALHDLKTKSKLRNDFDIQDEWVMPFDVINIINTPKFGEASAPKICADMDIKSQNDKEKLAIAKDEVYTEGFYKGVLNEACTGFAGQKVMDAKDNVKDQMIKDGQAMLYYEPEKEVMARSGCECVVKYTDQWFINYGDEEWKKKVDKHLETYETFKPDTMELFKHTVGWLREWGCSRAYGLGTFVPFDKRFVIESLSDSTIYMAYYTISHYLQSGPFNGSQQGSLQIDAADMNDDVWEYIFKKGKYPAGCKIPEAKLQTMKREFEYWYPMNMRVSGRDLIGNHLTFSLFNHMAMWGPEMMPKSCFTNGHVLMDGEKMSKSTGNFLTIEQGIEKYSADAVRIALANAGDTNDFANFETSVADTAVLKLFQIDEWATDIVASIKENKLRKNGNTVADRIFEASLDVLIEETDKAMNGMCFRDALKIGFYDLLNARDNYKKWSTGESMREDLALRYIRVQAVLVAPIAPHLAEQLWELVGGEGLCCQASWPQTSGASKQNYLAGKFVQKFFDELTPAVIKQRQGKKATEVNSVHVFVAQVYHPWQKQMLGILKVLFETRPELFPSEAGEKAAEDAKKKEMKGLMTQEIKGLGLEKKLIGTAMGFGDFVVKNMTGPESFAEEFPFDQMEVLNAFQPYLQTTLNCATVEILDAAGSAPDPKKRKANAQPGQPTFYLA